MQYLYYIFTKNIHYIKYKKINGQLHVHCNIGTSCLTLITYKNTAYPNQYGVF